MKRTLLAVFSFSVILFAACARLDVVDPFVDDTVTGPLIQINGKVTYTTIEGGAWIISGDDGSRYEPVNLPERFRKEGLTISVEAKIRGDMASHLMVGTIIEIRSIRQRENVM